MEFADMLEKNKQLIGEILEKYEFSRRMPKKG
jgi:hypothetical protein